MQPTRKDTRYQVLHHHANRLDGMIAKLRGLDRRFFWMRLFTLLVGLIGIVMIFFNTRIGVGIILLATLVFVIVVYAHQKVDDSLVRFQTAHRLALNQLARMKLDWENIPKPPDDRHLQSDNSKHSNEHPFERDLEITGRISLQHLIDVTVTLGGSERLKSWLLNTCPKRAQILSRQAVLRELQPLIGFRGRLSLNGALISRSDGERWDGSLLLGWLDKQEPDKSLPLYIILLLAMAVVNASLFLFSMIRGAPPLWLFSLGLYGIVYNIKHRQYGGLFDDAYQLGGMLEQFRVLFTYLERYPFSGHDRLKAQCEPFWNPETAPSRYLRSIKAITSAASLQNNQILWFLVNMIVPWDLFFTYRLQQFKSKVKHLLPAWLDAWYELEALNSLANFSYLNPDYTYPVMHDQEGGGGEAVFSARQLGHPLLLDKVRVCNDFVLEKLGEIVIVSGSNMSGKSTFLKTLGVNLCLAYAGAPVNAVLLETSLFRTFTAINVVDSLMDGISYFYAEVKRLKALLDAYQDDEHLPLLFLIDEIFRGTNNRERQIGSRAYVRALVGGHGVGVISTHDLALVHLADNNAFVHNYHFRERVEDGRMVFDYRLHPGPCPTTNALEIMALEGLPVE